VYAVCDRITVLRNGQLVGEYEISDLPRLKLVAAMMGKDFDDLQSIKSKEDEAVSDEVLIDAKGLSHARKIKPFDLDIHKQPIEKSCEQLNELIQFFDNETENGKLFLSYPMAEAINICDVENGLMSDDRKLFSIDKCVNDGFKHFADDLNRDTKTICRANCRENWLIISKANYEKAKWLMHLTSEELFSVLDQMQQAAILQHQQKLIKNDGVVATLGAFPFFLLEYVGVGKIQRMFNNR
jgi:hypothetical protein